MPDFLVPLLIIGPVAALLVGGRTLLAHRRAVALKRGDDVAFRVRLVGAAPPYPEKARRGRLSIGPSGLGWSPLHGGADLDLTGTGLIPGSRREARPGEGLGADEVVLTAVDGAGVPVRLVGRERALEQLAGALRARGLPADPVAAVVVQGRAPRAGSSAAHLTAAGLLLLALPLAGLTVWARTTGVHVTATVVSEPDSDDYCTVRWLDPRDGRTKDNGADCYWEVGDEVAFVALDDPLRGEVVEDEDTWAWAVVSGLLAVAAVAVVGVHHWRRRRGRSHVPTPTATALPAAPLLGASDLRYDEVVAAVRARAAREDWPFDRDLTAESPVRRGARKQLAWGVAGASWPLLAAVGAGLVFSWTSLAGLWASAGPQIEVRATVDGEPVEILPFLSEDLEVTFPLRDGGTSTTLVSVRRLPDPPPESLRVAYDPDDPDRARALEHDGAVAGGVVAVAGLLVGAGVTTWRWAALLSILREERRLRASGPGRHVLYVVVPDAEDNLHLLLFDDGRDAPPGHVVELVEDVRGVVPAAGTADVRGTYEPGGLVVVLVDGQELLTGSRLLAVQPEDVAGLVNDFAPTG